MLEGSIPKDSLEVEIATATRQYAKRQVTWFKKVVSDAELQGINEVDALIQHIQDADLL